MIYPLGLDVSSYQRTMDWQRAIDTGAKFVFVKATEGASWVDPTFAANWSELRRLGLPHGAYHFYRAQQDISQIWKFLEVVKPEADELLVIDIENNGGLSRVELTTNLVADVEYIEFITGRYPLIYSRASFLNSFIDMSKMPKLDYWLAQYRYPLPYPFFTEPYPSDKITIPAGVSREQVKFHQGSERGNGRRRGAGSYYIDLDTYIGTNDELAAYFGAAIVPEEHNVYLPIVITPLPPNDPLPQLPVEAMSQNDPRWKNNQLGTSGVTIGQQGCLITCVAMVQNYYGWDTDPAMVDAWLTVNNGYSNGNLLNWNSVPMQIATWEECQWTPAPLDKLDATLAKGEPAIVWVDFNPATATMDMHWVLIIGKLPDGDYTMIDPWDGWQGSFKSRYIDASRFIFRIVSYKRGDR